MKHDETRPHAHMDEQVWEPLEDQALDALRLLHEAEEILDNVIRPMPNDHPQKQHLTRAAGRVYSGIARIWDMWVTKEWIVYDGDTPVKEAHVVFDSRGNVWLPDEQAPQGGDKPMARILYQDDYVTIIWEDRGIIAYYDGTTDYEAHDILLGATLTQACDALRGQANDDIAEAILTREGMK